MERPPVIELAALVRLVTPADTQDEVDESLDEMRRLAWTAGADIRCTVVQRRERPCPATHIGSGKLEERKNACEELGVTTVLVDSDLTPTQGANMEDALGRKVVDRTQLILDIFAQRARTAEGKLQVELAQLQYLLPRLTGRGAVMRQQGGIGIRGPGEQKLEVDRRVIRDRIARLQRNLETVRKHRQVQRKQRGAAGSAAIALVGYTNAGKSSLLNALTGAEAFVEDKLFATLDPLTRRCKLPAGQTAFFSDTVGFVDRLPHSLVAAFRATLEAVVEADVLLLVVDAAHEGAPDRIRTVHEVLREIEATDKPTIVVLNKADVADPEVLADLALQQRRAGLDAVATSARTGEGLDALLRRVQEMLGQGRRRVYLRFPHAEGALIARLHEEGGVREIDYTDDAVLVEAEVGEALYQAVAPYLVERETNADDAPDAGVSE